MLYKTKIIRRWITGNPRRLEARHRPPRPRLSNTITSHHATLFLPWSITCPTCTTQNRNPRDIIRTTSSQNVRKVVIHRFRSDKFRQNNESESDYVTVAEFTQHMVMESLIDCILPICSEATRKKKTNVVRLVFGDRHETLVWMVDPADSAVDLLSDIPSIGVELCMLPSSSTADDYSGCLPTLTESDPIWDHAYLAATTTNNSRSSLSDAIFFIRTKDNAPIRRLTSSKNHHAAMTRAVRIWTCPDDPMRLARIETLDEEYASAAGDESTKKKKSSPSKKRSRPKPTTAVNTSTSGTPVAAAPPKSPSEDIPEAQVLVMDNEEKPAKKQQKEPLVWKPVMKKWDEPPRGIIQLDFTRDEMDMLAYHYEHGGDGTKAAAAKKDHDAADSSAAAAPMRLARVETLDEEYAGAAGDESTKKKKSSPSKKRSRPTPTTAVKTSTSGTPVAAAASPPKSPLEDIPEAQVLDMDDEEKPAKKQQKEPLVWKPVVKKWDEPPRGIIQLDFTRDEMDMLAYHYEHDDDGTTTNGDKKKEAAAAAKKDHDAADSSAAAVDDKASSSPKKKRKRKEEEKFRRQRDRDGCQERCRQLCFRCSCCGCCFAQEEEKEERRRRR